MFIDVNGATYAYTTQGEGEVLILLHGFTGTRKTWDNLIKKWHHAYQVLTIDLPGHGETMTRHPRTMEMVVDDLRNIVRKLNIDRAHFIGYSMGGRTALAYALTYPETVLTVTLESASPGLASHKERAERRQKDGGLIERLKSGGLESFINFWENIPLFATQKRLPKDVQTSVRKERLSQSTEGLIASLRYMGTGQQPSLWNNLQSLQRHVLLIVGGQDEKFVRLNEQMKRHLPKATLKVIKQAGHTVHLEQPMKFYHEVTTFIQTHKNNYI